MPDQGTCTQTRVKLDVDCSSLLRPHSTQTQLQSAAYIPEIQPRLPCSSSSLPAEESSPKADLPSLRLRVLPSHCSAACGESRLHARAPCSPSHYPSRAVLSPVRASRLCHPARRQGLIKSIQSAM